MATTPILQIIFKTKIVSVFGILTKPSDVFSNLHIGTKKQKKEFILSFVFTRDFANILKLNLCLNDISRKMNAMNWIPLKENKCQNSGWKKISQKNLLNFKIFISRKKEEEKQLQVLIVPRILLIFQQWMICQHFHLVLPLKPSTVSFNFFSPFWVGPQTHFLQF